MQKKEASLKMLHAVHEWYDANSMTFWKTAKLWRRKSISDCLRGWGKDGKVEHRGFSR